MNFELRIANSELRKAPILNSEFAIRNSKLLFVAAFVLCTTCTLPTANRTRLKFWGLGAEGEIVSQMIPEFERRYPDIQVEIQQIPWTAAHEKLLTAFVGEATPDVAQLGNTWVPEFDAIHALEDLTPWVARSHAVDRGDNFEGIWRTNLVNGRLYGVPWYVDTRVVFYRTDLLASVGYKKFPATWDEWVDAMQRLRARQRPDQYPILLPTDEWPHPVTFALEEGAPLLRDGGRYADFEEPRFEAAFNFYLSLYRRGFAPTLSRTDVANRYQQFATGDFAMLISGPWDVDELRKRLSPGVQWSTAMMPGPGGHSTSLAGGSSLVIFRASKQKEAAWKLIEFLSEPAQQLRFYELSRDLPARRSVWVQAGIAGDPRMASFREQLEHVTPTPQVPEWEEIATAITEESEQAIRGSRSAQQTLAALDARVNRMLTKRRWVLQQEAAR